MHRIGEVAADRCDKIRCGNAAGIGDAVAVMKHTGTATCQSEVAGAERDRRAKAAAVDGQRRRPGKVDVVGCCSDRRQIIGLRGIQRHRGMRLGTAN